MPMSPGKIDAGLRTLKGFGPYGVCLAFGLLGLSLFIFGGMATTASGKLDPSGKVLRWIGVCFCFLSLVAFGLWHFLGWPARLLSAIAESAPPKSTKSRATRS
jgi:hypothetical protein